MIVISATLNIQIGSQAIIIRSFRISRIFRLVKKAKSLKMIFNTIIITIPSLANVGGLLVLLLYLYAILGVFIFAPVRLNGALNTHANFQDFGIAFLTLIRVATGEAWQELLWACKRKPDVRFSCVWNADYDDYANAGYTTIGCGSDFAYVYFISFLIVVSMIFLNLFIAIILEGFSSSNEEEEQTVSESHIDSFRLAWSDYDPDATGMIEIPLMK